MASNAATVEGKPAGDQASPAGRRHVRKLLRCAQPELLLGLASFAFVFVTAVWLGFDQAPPDGDASRHLVAVFDARQQLLDSHELYWFRYEPGVGAIQAPLVYLVGVLGTVGGLGADGPIIVLNAVFVPLLAFGSYGVAREAFGRDAGLPAGLFVLAAPFTIGQFHFFMVDLPLAAMVAMTTWALLASRRFERSRLALIAGVLGGLGMMTKQPFVVFLAPVVLVVLARGGWRNWRGFALFLIAGAVVALPWYVEHMDGLRRVTDEATNQGLGINAFGTSYTRFSFANYAWYAWTFLNVHWYAPLAALFAAGTVIVTRRWGSSERWLPVPELLVGALVGYIGVALIFGYQDARYSFPSACFVAALAVGWVVKSRPRTKLVLSAGLGVLLLFNTVTITTGVLGRADVPLPGGEQTSVAGEWKLVLFANNGYTAAQPQRARVLDLLEAARADGIRAFTYEPHPETVSRLNTAGLTVFSRVASVPLVPLEDPTIGSRRGIVLAIRPVGDSDPRPCQRLSDGSGLYVLRGGIRSSDPRTASNLYCPL